MLFSWKRRKTDPGPTTTRVAGLPPSEMEWSSFENADNWPSVKVWMPTSVAQRLDQLATYRDQSRSEVMRDLLFIAIYGHFSYAQLLAERRGLLREAGTLQSGERVLFDWNQTADAMPPKPEKKLVNVRLFLPPPMKTVLDRMSERTRLTTSACTRGLIERMLDGTVGAIHAGTEAQ